MPFVPIVAVDLPADVAPEYATVALRACNLALGAGRCSVAVEPVGSQGNAWLATVRVDPAQPQVFRIDLKNAAPQSTQTSFTRNLDFEGNEPLHHRWSTAGVVVAALVISAESTTTAERTQPAQSGENSAKDVVAPRQPKAPVLNETRSLPAHPNDSGRNFRLDAGGLLGPSVEAGSLRFGALVRPSLELGRSTMAWTSLSVASGDGAVKAFWWSGAVGLGFVSTAENRRFGVEARLGFKGERVAFTASDGTKKDSAAETRFGGVAGLELTLGISRVIALWLGGEAEGLLPRLDVTVGGKKHGHLGILSGSTALGIRVRFDSSSK